jgi:hypothetical protein
MWAATSKGCRGYNSFAPPFLDVDLLELMREKTLTNVSFDILCGDCNLDNDV